MEICMIESAFDNKDELNKVVAILLKEKLVSSCQIVESDSRWNWNGEYEESKEYLVFMKTRKSLIQNVYEEIKKVHSYECFEFAVFDMNSCNNDYLKWIETETTK